MKISTLVVFLVGLVVEGFGIYAHSWVLVIGGGLVVIDACYQQMEDKKKAALSVQQHVEPTKPWPRT
jgi:hypothetical protein